MRSFAAPSPSACATACPFRAVIGRWGAEEFAAMLTVKKSEALASAKWITEHLSGVVRLPEGRQNRPPVAATHGGRRGDGGQRGTRNTSSTASARSWWA